jgi:cytochrome c oxidase subunit 2
MTERTQVAEQAPRVSALVAPRGSWWGPLGQDERLWFWVVVAWAVAMFVMMLFVWPAIGDVHADIDAYTVDEEAFAALADAFVEEHTVDRMGGVPVVAPPPGDVYLLARRFQFAPVLRLERGQTYRFLMSSVDVQHGFSMQPDNVNFQVMPGYITSLQMTPQEAGTYEIVCNEYCGLGHHFMNGRIVVVEEGG